MKKFTLYQHGGSLNHGCEALATTISSEIKRVFPDSYISLASFSPKDDKIDTINTVKKCNSPVLTNPSYVFFQLDKRLLNSKFLQDRFASDRTCIKMARESNCSISIGGDNYCYSKGKLFWATDRMMKKNGKKLMLWGASIDPEVIPGELADHLKVYDLITVRESITYNALKEHGFGNKIHLVSDPAFLLESERLPLPKNWKDGQMVGINLSPLILTYTKGRDIVLDSVYNLINYILENTEMNIALIPHVRRADSNDIETLRPIYEMYKDTNRILIIDDISLNCKQLKGYISCCRYFIGARTHSVIAAYSSGVPALCLGYSVKSKGIARDLFGSEKDLVLPVQTLTDPASTVAAFKKLMDNEDALKAVCTEKLPAYIKNAKKSAELLKELVDSE